MLLVFDEIDDLQKSISIVYNYEHGVYIFSPNLDYKTRWIINRETKTSPLSCCHMIIILLILDVEFWTLEVIR